MLDRDSCLYHYTSPQGLEGILRTKALWASDTAFLNDWKELIYAAEPLIERMTKYLQEIPTDPGDSLGENRRSIMQYAVRALRGFVIPPYSRGEAKNVYRQIYVASLTEEYDQLGQWRGYGKGGYAVGFAKGGLKDAAPQLARVAYGDTAVNDLCTSIIEYFKTRGPSGHPGTRGWSDAMHFIMPQLALVKHDAFEQEREWRLVVNDLGNRPVKVRTTSSALIPYVECSFSPSCVTEIVIGPGGNVHSERAVRALLTAHGYDAEAVQITQSRAPFRG
jgi:hypothetical protein